MPSAQQCSRVLQKQSKGGIGGWLFHRDGTSSHPKSADVHATNQNATQATARVAPPSIIHNDPPEYIPRVVSIRAGEGPADYMQEPSARRPTLPTVTPAARDATVQHLPTVQVLQQPQTVDRQPRAVPRVAASVQLEPPSHASVAQLASPRPWLPSAQWSAEPRPMSPVLQPMSPPPHPIPPPAHPMSPPPHPIPPPPHPMSPPPHPMPPALHPMSPALHPMSPAPLPPLVPSPMVFPVSLAPPTAPPTAVVETHRQTMPARSHHGPPMQEGPNHSQSPQEIPWLNTVTNNRPPAPTVPSQLLPAATNGQRVSQQGATSVVPDVVSTKHSRQRSAPGAYGDAPPVQHPPPVVPSPMVFPVSLAPPAAPPAAVAETHRQTMPARSHHVPPTQEGPSHTQTPQETPWPNTTANNRPSAPTVPSQPSPAVMNGHRVSPQGATSAVPDVVSTKHPRQRFTPGIYNDVPPVPATPSRPIAPDLAAAFPIREDNMEAYHRYPIQEERAQEIRASRNIPDQWDRHGHTQESAPRLVVSAVPSSERTPRSTKASPNLHPRPVHQGTPPKSAPPPVLPPTYQPQASANLDVPQAHDTAQPGAYNVSPQNPNSSAYPATSIYPSSSPRTHVDASPAINDPPVANAPSNNPSPKVKPGNPSPRSRSQAVAPPQPPQQGPSHPVAVHITNRTPSHETGSTTLLGHTPSSQGSMLLVPMSPTTQHQVIVPRVGNHSVRQSVHIPPVPDISGDRNTHASVTTPAPRQTSTRHYHSASAPTVPISSLLQPPPVRSQTQPAPKAPTPLSPTPVRSYSTAQALGDPYATRYPVSGYPGTPAPNARQLRSTIPSPSQESELNTPSSLAISTKLPIVSDEPIAPVMSTQSYQEPKKKSGFFQGLFRTKSAAQKRHPHESNLIDAGSRGQFPPVKLAPSKTPVPLQYESDSKITMAPSKLRKGRTPAATHPPGFTSLSQPPTSQLQPPPTPMAPPPTPLARFEERRISTVPNAFAASFRIVSSKRHRTMSGASAEAVDGTNAGVSLSSTVTLRR